MKTKGKRTKIKKHTDLEGQKVFNLFEIFRIFGSKRIRNINILPVFECPITGRRAPRYGTIGTQIREKGCPKTGTEEPESGMGI